MDKFQCIEHVIKGKGVVIDPEQGVIYRLMATADGKTRISKESFDFATNTVHGEPIETLDFIFPADAVKKFNQLNTTPGLFWRKDERVFFDKEKENKEEKYA